MLKKFHDALLTNDDILVQEDFSRVTFFANETGILGVDLDKINLDDVRLLVWRNKFEKRKAVKEKINKELMPVVWHSTRWWDWCISEDMRKKK